MNFIASIKRGIKIIDKRGSYILEASIVLPCFVIAMILLISVIPVIAAAENSLFAMGDEVRLAGISAVYTKEVTVLPVTVISRVKRENNVVDSVGITDYGFLHSAGNMDDLISIGVSLNYSKRNPLGLFSFLRVEQRVRGRAFTGKYRSDEDGGGIGEENSHIVYVFPNRGEKYHNRACPFLNPACQKVFLTKSIRNRFRPCTTCNSSSASLGSQVFCFFTDGEVYHLGNCSAVDKYYIEMEQKDAEARGYSCCLSCGG